MNYIPLNSANSTKKKSHDGQQQLQNTPNFYWGCDMKLKSRVTEYMENQSGKLVGIDDIVDTFRSTYREYSKKKRASFKLAVIKVYNAYCKQSDYERNTPKCEKNGDVERRVDTSFDSDFCENDVNNERYVHYKDTNSANKALCSLYDKPTPTKPSDKTGSRLDAESTTCTTPTKTPSVTTPKLPNSVETVEKKDERKNSEDVKPENDETTPSTKKRKLSSTTKQSKSTKAKRKLPEIVSQKSKVTFADVGGNDKCLMQVCQLLVHLKHPEVYVQLGVLPPRGLLLHGPPGCGKTLLANAIAGELDLPFFKVAATEIVSGVSGDSEMQIRRLFGTAVGSAPCILFIDEIDAITPKRETAQREMERRIVAQLLICMDELNSTGIGTQVLVIGATNRPDSLDPALRRAGRFDREISMGIPDGPARIRILKVLCKKLKLESNFNFDHIAKNTPGYVGADLMALTTEASMIAVNRVFHSLQLENCLNGVVMSDVEMVDVAPPSENLEWSTVRPVDRDPSLVLALSWLQKQSPLSEQQLQDLYVKMEDFQGALKVVQPSAKREGFATVPDVTWDDIGALRDIREELQLTIMAPIHHPDKFSLLGLSSPAGILLCGPPGCGKTLLAKAVANESGLNFISVKGPELLNMYVGESERAVRRCFQRARNSAPCVIFFDELDALCPRRTDTVEGGVGARVVNQLLTEMDGMDTRKDVFILGATNRPDIIDPAVLRPGRLDKIVYVGLPAADDRIEILRTLSKNGTKPCMEPDVSLEDVGNDPRCNGFTGADLSALVREASLTALKEYMTVAASPINDTIRVGRRHFEVAFSRIRVSVSPKDRQMYEKMKEDFSRKGVPPSI